MKPINEVYQLDNLQLLSRLDTSCVNLIYCDILYGTGKKFKDYTDLPPEKNEIDKHYIPRIHEMKRVLEKNGTIYLQMDLRIVHWIRNLMDGVFGYENFRNQIVVKFNIGGRGKKEFAKKHDYIIVYTKSDEFVFNDLDIRVPYKSVISKKQDRPNITEEKFARTIPISAAVDLSSLKCKRTETVSNFVANLPAAPEKACFRLN